MSHPTTEDFIAALQRLARSGEPQKCGSFVFTKAAWVKGVSIRPWVHGQAFRTFRAGINEGLRYFPRKEATLRRLAQEFAERDGPQSQKPIMIARDGSEE